MPGFENKHAFEISVFDGGLNTKVQELSVLPSQTPSAEGWVYDDYGALVTRNGYKTHNSSMLATFVGIDGLYSYKPSTMSALLVAICNGSVYRLTGIATTPVMIGSSQSLFTVNAPAEMTAFQEILFVTNGGQQPYKFNGNEFTRAGISAPTQALTAFSDAGAGNLTGTYKYIYWGVNSYAAEGDYGTASTAVVFAAAKVRINNIPTAPASHGIITWKVGRNTAGASGVFWYLTDVANGTTSFTDNAADSTLDTLAPVDQGYLRRFNFFIAYAGRLWGAVEDYLWYSNLNQPEEFPSENFIRVGRGDGMNISSIKAFNGSIVISKSDYAGKTATYSLLIGDSGALSDPENWYLALTSDFGGGESQRATTAYSKFLMLYNRDGAFAYDGAGISPTGAESRSGAILADAISQNIEDTLRPASVANYGLARGAAAINWKNKVWLSIDRGNRSGTSYGTGTICNYEIFQFDYARISDSRRKGGAWSFVADVSNQSPILYPGISCFAIHENRLFGGASLYSDASGLDAQGHIYELDTTGSDGGATKTCTFITAPILGVKGHEWNWKDFRFIGITCSGTGTLKVRYAADRQASSFGSVLAYQESTITLSSTITRYRIDLDRNFAVGKRIQFAFVIAASASHSCTISKFELFYTIRGLRNG